MPHFFGLHGGHLPDAVTAPIEREFAHDCVTHVNYTEPGAGARRGWWECFNRGNPFDARVAREVLNRLAEVVEAAS